MSDGSARINSPDTLREVRIHWVKFDDNVRQGVSGIKSDIQKTMQWLQQEQFSYWRTELRKAEDAVVRARSDYNMARFGSEAFRKNSYIDEQKALRRAEQRKEDAEKKMVSVKKWITALPVQAQKMVGPVDTLGITLENATPRALAKLDFLAEKLEEYLRQGPPSAG
jgi:hypothetical protein